MSFNPYFISYTNINSKWLLDLLIEAKTKHPGKKKKKKKRKKTQSFPTPLSFQREGAWRWEWR